MRDVDGGTVGHGGAGGTPDQERGRPRRHPPSPATFRSRAWSPAVKASGLDFPVRIHDLRHAHASWLLAGGADLKSVMDRMGHSLIQTPQKYLHTLPDTDQRNLDAFTRSAGSPD